MSQPATMTEDSGENLNKTATSSVPEKPNRLLPWIVLLLAALAMLYFLNRGCASQNTSGKEGVMEANIHEEGSTTDPINGAGTVLTRMAEALATGAINNNEAFVLDGVRFKDRSATLTSASNTQLTALATLLRKYPAIDIRIEAHTDNDGNVKENLDLSVAQALAVKNHLHQNSIPAIRIAVAGRGQYKPLSVNNTAAGKAMNNRIEIYLNKKE
jgi:outer membrane protein OmpA-like peptidoglycan-associated protein